MARLARFTIPDGIYHIMSRGNNKMEIFHEPEDYEAYLNILMNNKRKYNFKLFRYVLMPNHVHLVAKFKEGGTLSQAMKRINVMYVQYYRKKYGGVGHFFQGRYKSYVVEDSAYFRESSGYIEHNPVKAGIVEREEDYLWSSARYYAGIKGLYDSLIDWDEDLEGELPERRREEKEGKAEFDQAECYRIGGYGSREYLRELIEKWKLRPRRKKPGRPAKGWKATDEIAGID